MNFCTRILDAGDTEAKIEVPARIVEALGAGRQPHVRITINGYSYSDTVAMTNGKFMIAISALAQQASGAADGETVDVTIEWDDEPAEVKRHRPSRSHRDAG